MTEPRLSVFPLMCLFIKGSFKPKWIYEMMKGELKSLQEDPNQSPGWCIGGRCFGQTEAGTASLVSILSRLSKKNVIHTGRLFWITDFFFDQPTYCVILYLLFLCLTWFLNLYEFHPTPQVSYIRFQKVILLGEILILNLAVSGFYNSLFFMTCGVSWSLSFQNASLKFQIMFVGSYLWTYIT